MMKNWVKLSPFLAVLCLSTIARLEAEPVTFFGIPVEGTETPSASNSSVSEKSPEPGISPAPVAPSPASVGAGNPLTGPRILVIFDVSMSVVKKANETKFSMARIKAEALELIKNLPDNASVGVIQFTRNYKTFGDELVLLTPENRSSVKQWVSREWVDSGAMPSSSDVKSNPKAVIGVLEKAAQMHPDVIYLISDGSFQWGAGKSGEKVPWREFSRAIEAVKNGGRPVVINFIGFQIEPEDKTALSSIVQRSGGKMADISKK